MRRIHQQVEGPIFGELAKVFHNFLSLGGIFLHGVPLIEILVGVNSHLAKSRSGIEYIVGFSHQSVKKLFQRKQIRTRIGEILHILVSIVVQRCLGEYRI